MSKHDIKKLRKRLQLTQAQLAKRLGVSWSTVARWESGITKPQRWAERALLVMTEPVPRKVCTIGSDAIDMLEDHWRECPICAMRLRKLVMEMELL